ncbi:MAG: hypothetical protein ABI809_07175, partial [Caldimonas sp.]
FVTSRRKRPSTRVSPMPGTPGAGTARAAEHAAGRMAHAAALEHVSQALAMLDRTGDSPRQAQAQAPLRWRLLRAREQTLDMQGERERQATDLDAMDRVAEMLGDDARWAYAAYRRAYRAMRMAAWSECEQSARRAVALADAALASGAGSAVPVDADDGLHGLRLISLRLLGTATMFTGRWDDAQALLQQTLDEARARGLLKAQADCLNSLAVLAGSQDDPVRMPGLFREGLNLYRQTGDRRGEATALGNVGGAWLNLGDLAAARHDLEDGLRLTRQNGDRVAECAPLCSLSALALWQDDDARALAFARSALDTAMAVQARDWEAEASTRLGDAEAALGRLAPAAQAYARAAYVAHAVSSGWQFEASAGLARLALAQGDIGGALSEVESLLLQADASAQADAVGGPAAAGEPVAADAAEAAAASFDGAAEPRRTELTIHRVLAAAGDPRATAWLQHAHRALMAQANAITDAALRQMLLTNIPYHREIVALWGQQQAAR